MMVSQTRIGSNNAMIKEKKNKKETDRKNQKGKNNKYTAYKYMPLKGNTESVLKREY